MGTILDVGEEFSETIDTQSTDSVKRLKFMRNSGEDNPNSSK